MTEQRPFKHIVRVANVDLPGGRPTSIALTHIKGIGINFADVVCAVAGINKGEKVGTLSDEEIKKLNAVVQNPSSYDIPSWFFNRRKDYDSGEDMHLITGTISFATDNDLKRLKKIKTLRGIRHQKGLPVRGQRTKSHFRKNKGKFVGVANKKAAPAAAEGKKESPKGKKE